VTFKELSLPPSALVSCHYAGSSVGHERQESAAVHLREYHTTQDNITELAHTDEFILFPCAVSGGDGRLPSQ
jgi:hypothetical protein